VKLGILMVRHPATRHSPILREVVRMLRQWGARVDVIYPEERVASLARVRVEHDLYVLKSGTSWRSATQARWMRLALWC